MASFTKKEIEVIITLGQGTFGGKGNTKIFRGFAVNVNVEKVGPPDKNKAKVKIYNVNLDEAAQMTTLAFEPLKSMKNKIAINAGEKTDTTLSRIFAGEITNAYASFEGDSDIAMYIEAMSGYYPSLIPQSPMAITGGTQVSHVMEQLSDQIGYTFVNDGVTLPVGRTILNGSPIQKINQLANETGASVLIEDDQIVLLNAEQTRKGNAIYLSKDTGLLGYPTFTSNGISLKAIFNADFKYRGAIEVESIVPKASGVWQITKLVHDISANVSGEGKWESSIEGTHFGKSIKGNKKGK